MEQLGKALQAQLQAKIDAINAELNPRIAALQAELDRSIANDEHARVITLSKQIKAIAQEALTRIDQAHKESQEPLVETMEILRKRIAEYDIRTQRN